MKQETRQTDRHLNSVEIIGHNNNLIWWVVKSESEINYWQAWKIIIIIMMIGRHDRLYFTFTAAPPYVLLISGWLLLNYRYEFAADR
jgi:hypothetical protein